jgi:hypothetical protein
MGWAVNATPWPLYLREWPGTHCKGCWVGPGAGLDGCRKPCLLRDSIPGPPSPSLVAIPTQSHFEITLSWRDLKSAVFRADVWWKRTGPEDWFRSNGRARIFKKYGSHLEILGPTRVTWSKCHTEVTMQNVVAACCAHSLKYNDLWTFFHFDG